MNTFSVAAVSWLSFACFARSNNVDRFNYRETEGQDFGPEEWSKVSCSDPGVCLGYPNNAQGGIGWEIGSNNCRWCPATGNKCGQHRQSPIRLMRDTAVIGDDDEKECIDWHWMKYEDGSCSWSDMIDNPTSIHRNNFRIERHGLKILQPLDADGDLQCSGRRFPRIDFSKGFHWWWFMTHTEIKVPSEHTQAFDDSQPGKGYDAEVHLTHIYSKDKPTRKLGKVAIFMNGYSDQPKWPFLDKLICQWRIVEEETREACGLASVSPSYPGCSVTRRNLRVRNSRNESASSEPSLSQIQLHEENFQEDPDFDFESMLEEYVQRESDKSTKETRRHLANFDNVTYFPYEWMLKVNTEYYFRYEGTQLVPPCFETVHWRVVKDPIRVHTSQIKELERLIATRIAPSGSEFNECKRDTAGKDRQGSNGTAVDVNRPLQSFHSLHRMMLCECKDWPSKFEADRNWCKIDIPERFTDHPYNFDSDGF